MTQFLRLREMVATQFPEQLHHFDLVAHKLQGFNQDDDLLCFVEAAGFLTLLFGKIPEQLEKQRVQLKADLDGMIEQTKIRKNNLQTNPLFQLVDTLTDKQTAHRLDQAIQQLTQIHQTAQSVDRLASSLKFSLLLAYLIPTFLSGLLVSYLLITWHLIPRI